jgi:hypothetical protein
MERLRIFRVALVTLMVGIVSAVSACSTGPMPASIRSTPPTILPPTQASPTVAPTPSGDMARLELFWNYQGVLYCMWSDNGGASWSPSATMPPPGVGNTWVGAPSAVSDGAGRLTVFARDARGLLWIDTDSNGSWSGWSVLPSVTLIPKSAPVFAHVTNSSDLWLVTSDPTATSWGPGRMDVFAYGVNGKGAVGLLHTWAINDTWVNKWEVLGTGLMQGNPAAVSWGPGRLDVFVTGGGNRRAHKWFDSSHWSGWEDMESGTVYSSPAVTSWGPGRLDVFAHGPNGHLRHMTYGSAWEDLGCCVLEKGATPAAISQSYLTLDVFTLGTDGWVYSKAYNNLWSDFKGVSVLATGVAAVVWKAK